MSSSPRDFEPVTLTHLTAQRIAADLRTILAMPRGEPLPPGYRGTLDALAAALEDIAEGPAA